MPKVVWRIMPFLLVSAAFGVPSLRADVIPPQKVDGKIAWVYNYAEGQRLARETGKPLFVVFRCER
jgi:hypothetical protein